MACSIEGCGKKVKAFGLCENHRYRLKKHGSPFGGRTENGAPLAFLINAISFDDEESCLPWPFSRNNMGYGQVTIEGQKWVASRYLATMKRGEPPTPKHEAAHTCGKGHEGCVNPNHIVWKTRLENDRDKLVHGTGLSGPRHPNAKLDDETVKAVYISACKFGRAATMKVFDMSYWAVRDIHCGRRWSSVTRKLEVPACQS